LHLVHVKNGRDKSGQSGHGVSIGFALSRLFQAKSGQSGQVVQWRLSPCRNQSGLLSFLTIAAERNKSTTTRYMLTKEGRAVGIWIFNLSSFACAPGCSDPRPLPEKLDAADAVVDGWYGVRHAADGRPAMPTRSQFELVSALTQHLQIRVVRSPDGMRRDWREIFWLPWRRVAFS